MGQTAFLSLPLCLAIVVERVEQWHIAMSDQPVA
jgi:hypothetical protein